MALVAAADIDVICGVKLRPRPHIYSSAPACTGRSSSTQSRSAPESRRPSPRGTSCRIPLPGGASPAASGSAAIRFARASSSSSSSSSSAVAAAMTGLTQTELCSPGSAATTKTTKSVQLWRTLVSWVAVLFHVLLQIPRRTPSWAQLVSFVGLRQNLLFSPSSASPDYKPLAVDLPTDAPPPNQFAGPEPLKKLTVCLSSPFENWAMNDSFKDWFFFFFFLRSLSI